MATSDLPIRPGATVRFLDDVGGGRVVRLEGDSAWVEDETGFERLHPLRGLVRVGLSFGEEDQAYERMAPSLGEVLTQEIAADKRRKLEQDWKRVYEHDRAAASPSDTTVVDLHLHRILPDATDIGTGVVEDVQLAHFERMLQWAIAQRLPRIVFVHGIGSGPVRHAIYHRVEAYYPGCSCRPADPRIAGSGATEVRIGSGAHLGGGG
jgi:hypothetical protein